MAEQEPLDDAPRCARHPRRVSYVRCQRCDLPACPECQRPAAVGVQCVDCVKKAAKTQRTARTAAGAPATSLAEKPTVTYTIIGVCIAAYLLQLVLPNFTNDFAWKPVLADRQPWRMVTAGFLHSPSGVLSMHLIFNMYALFIVGQVLEPLMGKARFLGMYVATLLAGNALFALVAGTVYYDQGQPIATAAVGASGAVFGLFGALLVFQRRVGAKNTGLFIVLGINLVLGFVVPGIAWEAHVGGLAAGALLAALMSRTVTKPRSGLIAGAAMGIVSILGIVGCIMPALLDGF